MTISTVTVYGNPAPKGSLRSIGKGRMIEDNENTEPWRALVANAAMRDLKGFTVDDAVAVEMTFTLKRANTITPARRPWPTKRSPGHGDIDKLARCVLDALQDVGILVDDAQIVEVTARKGYADSDAPDLLDRPGMVLHVMSLDREASS